MEGEEKTPDSPLADVLEDAKEESGHSEFDMVLVVILLGLLGIAFFVWYVGSGGKYFDNENKVSEEIAVDPLEEFFDVNTPNPRVLRVEKTSPESEWEHFVHAESGLTLYYIDGNECAEECLNDWTPYTYKNEIKQGKLFTLEREDTGEHQFVWKGKFLYTYNGDKPGDSLGDGYGGVWHILRP